MPRIPALLPKMMPAGFLRRSILTSTTGLHRGTSPTASRLVSTMNSQVYKTVKDLSGTPVGVGDSAGPAFTRRVILLRYLPVRRFRRVETTKLTGVNTTIRTRSEERRVGEEGRYRGGADHLKKKNETRPSPDSLPDARGGLPARSPAR